MRRFDLAVKVLCEAAEGRCIAAQRALVFSSVGQRSFIFSRRREAW